MRNRIIRKEMLSLVEGGGRSLSQQQYLQEVHNQVLSAFAGVRKLVKKFLFIPGYRSSLCRLPAPFGLLCSTKNCTLPSVFWFFFLFFFLFLLKASRQLSGSFMSWGHGAQRQGQDPDLQQFLCLASETSGFLNSRVLSRL